MAEVLWAQLSGVDYSAAEDRRLVSSIYTPGVIYGLAVSAGTGLSAKVSAGRCVIDDGSGGAYLAYFDAATTVTLSASASNTLYVTFDPTTAQAQIVKGAAPTTPYLQIGSATTSSSAVTSVSNVRAAAVIRATPPPVAVTSSVIAMPTGQAWSIPSASPWMVELSGNVVYMSGRLTRTTADIAPGVEATFGGAALIPAAYRPAHPVSAVMLPDSGSSILGHLTVLTDGTVTYSQNFGTFPTNGTLRIVNTAWLTTS